MVSDNDVRGNESQGMHGAVWVKRHPSNAIEDLCWQRQRNLCYDQSLPYFNQYRRARSVLKCVTIVLGLQQGVLFECKKLTLALHAIVKLLVEQWDF